MAIRLSPEQLVRVRQWVDQKVGSVCGACQAELTLTPWSVLDPLILSHPVPDRFHVTGMTPILMVIPVVCPRCANVQLYDVSRIAGLDPGDVLQYKG